MATTRFHLDAHRMQRLASPAVVRATSGLVWLTVDRVPEDILLAAGESRHFARGAEVIAYALGGEACFETSTHDTADGGAGAWRLGWAERLGAWRKAFAAVPAASRLGGTP